MNVQDLFWKQVDKNGVGMLHFPELSSCWEWVGKTLISGGYGQFNVANGQFRAHVFSWELHNGRIMNKLKVLHHCDNPICVRPSHLFLGTNSDNMIDCYDKGRSNFITNPDIIPRGINHHATHLTISDIRAIRDMFDRRCLLKFISKEFNISISAVSNIGRRITFKDI